jgi:hypothetical protein
MDFVDLMDSVARTWKSKLDISGSAKRHFVTIRKHYLLNQVDERRPANATLAQLLERHLSMLKVAPSTMSGYRGYVERHTVRADRTHEVGCPRR